MREFNKAPGTEFISPPNARRIKKSPRNKIKKYFQCCVHPCITLMSSKTEHKKKNLPALTPINTKGRRQRASMLSPSLSGQYEAKKTVTPGVQHLEHKDLIIANFKLLREKYDDLKRELHQILWEFIPTQQSDNLAGFSDLGQVNHAIFETPDRIGSYTIGSLLGEGQFSVVKLCTHNVTRKQYAVKMIQKNKISTLHGLKRVSIEVRLLQKLQHPNIIKSADYIHSPTYIYLFMEVGGPDLFEYFQANPFGAGVDVTRQIILGIVKALLYLHSNGICHRDLKPENILLCEAYADKEIKCQNVRICDFGQSASIATKNSNGILELNDLCGSPGFFAQEMIIGADTPYNGFLADVWSVGCIMLELTMGHENFCHQWMASYDYEMLKDEHKFQKSLQQSVMRLKKRKEIATNGDQEGSKDMNSFLQGLLVIDPKLRFNASQMLDHKWFDGFERTVENIVKI
jgi:tRNA A-37 threonylcarbamoyl transferase component Bud32